jgi:hypothetical protein
VLRSVRVMTTYATSHSCGGRSRARDRGRKEAIGSVDLVPRRAPEWGILGGVDEREGKRGTPTHRCASDASNRSNYTRQNGHKLEPR